MAWESLVSLNYITCQLFEGRKMILIVKQGSQKKPMVKTITRKKKGKAKERPKNVQPVGTKEGRKLILLVVGSYFTHNPFNVTCMQIMKSNSNRRSRTNISCQCNLLLYSRA
jgi:hypothetical protein